MLSRALPLYLFVLLPVSAAHADDAASAGVLEPASRRLGELVLARGQLAFAPCLGAVAQAHGASGGAEAASLVARLNGGADGSVFLDADIGREPDGGWRIERIRRAYRDGPRCLEDLVDFVWRAAGVDGSWTMSTSRRYVSVRRKDERALFFRYRPFEAAGDGQWTFSARAEGTAINMVLRGERCVDEAAGRLTDWSLRFTLGGTEFKGCAWAGASD